MRSAPNRSPRWATRLPTPRGRLPRRSIFQRSSAGPVRDRPRCASHASGRSRRWWRSRPISPPDANYRVVWGVHCVVAEDAQDLDDMVSPRRHDRLPRRFCQGRTARHHRRRRAAWRPRHHQHGPHRLRWPERRRRYVNSPVIYPVRVSAGCRDTAASRPA